MTGKMVLLYIKAYNILALHTLFEIEFGVIGSYSSL